jgi:hypothetical protein
MAAKDEEREKRLAAALRENLKRRKSHRQPLSKSDADERDEP